MTAAEELRHLDDELLAAVPGQETRMAELLARRAALLPALCGSLEELEMVAARTNQLQERLLHWRRLAIMELTALEQHVRFAASQVVPSPADRHTHLRITL